MRRPQLNANNRRRKDIHTLPLADRDLLDSLGYKERILDADKAILANAVFLDAVVASPEIFSADPDDDDPEMRGNDQEDSEDEDDGEPLQGEGLRIDRACRVPAT